MKKIRQLVVIIAPSHLLAYIIIIVHNCFISNCSNYQRKSTQLMVENKAPAQIYYNYKYKNNCIYIKYKYNCIYIKYNKHFIYNVLLLSFQHTCSFVMGQNVSRYQITRTANHVQTYIINE